MAHQAALLAGCPAELVGYITAELGEAAQVSSADVAALEAAADVDVVLLGPEVASPVTSAQEIFRRRKDVVVVLARTAADRQQIAEALRFAPFVGISTRTISSDDPRTVVSELRDALQIAAARGRHRRELDTAVRALATAGGPANAGFLRTVQRLEAVKNAITEAALDAIVTIDHRGVIVEYNPAAEALFGYTAAEATGRELAELLVPPQLRARHRAALVRYVRSGGGKLLGRRIEVQALRRGGEEFPVELSIVRLPGSEPPLLTGFARDLRERRAAQEAALLRARAQAMEAVAEERRRWAERLELANRELEAFSYSVSHDLRAPLRAIDGFAKAMLTHQQQLDERGRHHLRRVRAAAQRMSRLIDALLRLSRITRAPLEKTGIDLAPLAREVIAELRAAEPARRVDVEIATGLTVKADPYLARVVLENLLGNAWKFTSRCEAARIGISRELRGAETVFCVRDNGAGFDMKYAGKLFAPFRRMHAEGDFEGTGIGLATVERIVARHGGRIWAEAAVDRGAAFFFTLAE